jgi:hypothetical protein
LEKAKEEFEEKWKRNPTVNDLSILQLNVANLISKFRTQQL